MGWAPARFDEMLAHCALFQSVCFGEFANGLAIFPRAQSEHEFFPDGFRQRFAAMKHLVTAQTNFAIFARTNARPPYRNFLPHHDGIALFAAPAAGGPSWHRLAAFADHLIHFFFHQQLHQLQSCLPDQFTCAFAQPSHYLGHRQHHLHRRVSFRCHLFELFYGSLRFDLISSLHSDSPFFLRRKSAPSLSRPRS